MRYRDRAHVGLWLVAISFSTHAVIIRDDVPDTRYHATSDELPALVDLPGEGGGALISPQWFVTAGHAVHGYMLDEVMIGGKARKVEKVVFVPGFRTVSKNFKWATAHRPWPLSKRLTTLRS